MEDRDLRRQHPRFAVETPVEVWSGDVNDRKLSMTGSCVNISEAGLMMRVPTAIPLLTQVAFRIGKLNFQGTGTVRHCGNNSGYSMVGVEFDAGQRFDLSEV